MPADLVVVVDDNPTNLKLLRMLLTVEGYEVRTAQDAQEALAVLDECRPRLILMDLQLPGMSGFELTRLLKSRPSTRDIPIVAVSSFAMKGDEERALSAGCDAYVTKPINTTTLPTLIARYARTRPC